MFPLCISLTQTQDRALHQTRTFPLCTSQTKTQESASHPTGTFPQCTLPNNTTGECISQNCNITSKGTLNSTTRNCIRQEHNHRPYLTRQEHNHKLRFIKQECDRESLFLVFFSLTSQQCAKSICSNNCMCCHTDIDVADQTCYLTQTQYTGTLPASPSTDSIMPGARQRSHCNINF